ncbi:MAG: hypothetical protein OEQ28_05245 [Acidobacteriota bacterium]|nr:hypothetical protein [Acidobacteriota bacterium]
MALSADTEYKNHKEKVDSLAEILISSHLFEKDRVLARKLLSEIAEILFEDVKKNSSDEYSQTLNYLARSLLAHDEPLSFKFALMSLAGDKPAIQWRSLDLFAMLKSKNPGVANEYLTKVLDIVRATGQSDEERLLRIFSFEEFFQPFKNHHLSDSHNKQFLEVLAQLTQTETEELLQKTRSGCASIYFSAGHIAQYKKLLPQRVGTIQQGIELCRTLGGWEQGLNETELMTTQDYLDLAERTVENEKRQSNRLSAVNIARKKSDYGLAIKILDSIPESNRPDWWNAYRITTTSSLISQLARKQKTSEIRDAVKQAPQVLQPYIIIRSIDRFGGFSRQNKDLTLDLMHQARTEIMKMRFPKPSKVNDGFILNPTHIVRLVSTYYWLGNQDEALETFSEYVELLNQVSQRFSYKDQHENSITYFSYSRFVHNFLDHHFDRINQDVGRIETKWMRVFIRMRILGELIDLNRNRIPGIP